MRGSTAGKVVEEKEQHPERFCSHAGCLWRVLHRGGAETPCPKHPSVAAVHPNIGGQS